LSAAVLIPKRRLIIGGVAAVVLNRQRWPSGFLSGEHIERLAFCQRQRTNYAQKPSDCGQEMNPINRKTNGNRFMQSTAHSRIRQHKEIASIEAKRVKEQELFDEGNRLVQEDKNNPQAQAGLARGCQSALVALSGSPKRVESH